MIVDFILPAAGRTFAASPRLAPVDVTMKPLIRFCSVNRRCPSPKWERIPGLGQRIGSCIVRRAVFNFIDRKRESAAAPATIACAGAARAREKAKRGKRIDGRPPAARHPPEGRAVREIEEAAWP
ncbi:MAG: hypothetical protein IPH65_17545 [Dehalococcoidia bacterium]|uniref:hypothetical protein n=1 Tax=Candidatus Amarobacter glycogenicus TaxID=3140699 RepID=UPI0031348FF6|nr:hypothetical protein [Dehalococcoidia bacterium]